MDIERHEVTRRSEVWGTYGINGNEPFTPILIQDLADSHIVNIITDLESREQIFSVRYFLTIINNEIEYRKLKGISVLQYKFVENFKLGKNNII